MASDPILLVEDDTNARGALGELLRDEGYAVLEAADGNLGWRLFQDRCPGLVFADIMMPGLDGLELCRRIRGSVQPCPVVLVTASARLHEVPGLGPRFSDCQAEARQAGASAYMEKPINFNMLLSLVNRYLPLQPIGGA